MKSSLSGALYAGAAGLAWGTLPIYWKLLKAIPSYEILAHRILWSFLFYFLLVLTSGRWRVLREALRSWRIILAASALIGVNWFSFISAINSGHVLEASLGYFLNPLVSVLLGVVILRENLNGRGRFAVFLGAIGLTVLASFNDRFPWYSLVLATTFSTYSLIRKKIPTDTLSASALESFFILPPVIYFLFNTEPPTSRDLFWLSLSGPLTGLPLIWFANAAKRLSLSSLGFFGYLSPTLQFLLGIFLFNETFSLAHAIGFGLVWLGIFVYSLDAWLARGAGDDAPNTAS